VERHDRERRLRVSAYQDAPSPPLTPEIRAAAAGAVQYVHPDGRFVSGSRAVFATLRRIGYPGPWRVLAWPPFVWVAELGYRIVARNRGFFSRILLRGEAPACGVEPRDPDA
jgi:predicted DCC family thiol-disulfide oxidoreductase YuxK